MFCELGWVETGGKTAGGLDLSMGRVDSIVRVTPGGLDLSLGRIDSTHRGDHGMIGHKLGSYRFNA